MQESWWCTFQGISLRPLARGRQCSPSSPQSTSWASSPSWHLPRLAESISIPVGSATTASTSKLLTGLVCCSLNKMLLWIIYRQIIHNGLSSSRCWVASCTDEMGDTFFWLFVYEEMTVKVTEKHTAKQCYWNSLVGFQTEGTLSVQRKSSIQVTSWEHLNIWEETVYNCHILRSKSEVEKLQSCSVLGVLVGTMREMLLLVWVLSDGHDRQSLDLPLTLSMIQWEAKLFYLEYFTPKPPSLITEINIQMTSHYVLVNDSGRHP